MDSGNRILDLMNNAVQSGSSGGISALSSVENILHFDITFAVGCNLLS